MSRCIVKSLMFACPLFRVPHKAAKLKDTNVNCRPKIDRNYYSISNYMVLIRQNKGAKIIFHAVANFKSSHIKGFYSIVPSLCQMCVQLSSDTKTICVRNSLLILLPSTSNDMKQWTDATNECPVYIYEDSIVSNSTRQHMTKYIHTWNMMNCRIRVKLPVNFGMFEAISAKL